MSEKNVLTTPWYLLFHGTSPDGRGGARYQERTENPEKARDFLRQERADPYTTSYVVEITSHTYQHRYRAEDIIG